MVSKRSFVQFLYFYFVEFGTFTLFQYALGRVQNYTSSYLTGYTKYTKSLYGHVKRNLRVWIRKMGSQIMPASSISALLVCNMQPSMQCF